MKKIFLILALFLISVSYFGADIPLPVMLVLPSGTGDAAIKVNFVDYNIKNSQITNHLFSELVTYLRKSNKFTVPDKRSVKSILKENRLSYSDWSTKAGAVHTGKILLADYVLLCKIKEADFSEKPIFIKLTGKRGKIVNASIKFDIRILKVSDGKILFDQEFNKRINSRNLRISHPKLFNESWTLSQYRRYILKKAVNDAGQKIIEKIFPEKTLPEKRNNIPFNKDSKEDYSVGEMYNMIDVKSKKADTNQIKPHVIDTGNTNINKGEPAYPMIEKSMGKNTNPESKDNMVKSEPAYPMVN